MNNSSEQQIQNFVAIAKLQNELLNLDFCDEFSLKNFTQKLLSSPLLNSKWTFRSVLVSIYTCFLSRPHSNFNYINLFIEIAQNEKNSFSSDDYIINFTNKFFIYQLYKANLVTIKSIYEEANRSSDFGLYFYPELKQHYLDSPIFIGIDFSLIKNSIKSIGYIIDDNDSQAFIQKFIELRSKGKNPSNVALSIRSDDVELLQQLLSQSNTPIDSIVEYSIFERFIFINEKQIQNNPSLIEYAAFFGSINCFRFLFQKYSKLPETTAKYAVAGGNYEIIHLCEQNQVRFTDEALAISIRFFRSELTEYIEQNFDLEKTADDVSKSLVYYNLQALMDCKKVITKDPNKPDSRGYNVLALASLNGDLDIINYIIQTFGDQIDLNYKNEYNNSAFYYAAGHGHFEVVKYFSQLPKVDINLENDRNYTALHFAAKKGHLNIVKFLCSLPNININADCRENIHPIDCAVENGHIEIINFLASLPDIIIYDITSEKRSILESAVISRRVDIIKIVWNLIKDCLKKLHINDTEQFMTNNEIFIYHRNLAITLSKYIQDTEITNFLISQLSNNEQTCN